MKGEANRSPRRAERVKREEEEEEEEEGRRISHNIIREGVLWVKEEGRGGFLM